MYKCVLIAVDLSEASSHRALDCATKTAAPDARLQVLHVVEPQYVQYSLDPTLTGSMTRELEQNAISNAQQRLHELCKPYGIGADAQYVRLGRVAHQTHTLATELGADLIVLGSHGYHGWRAVLGSKANAILHGTPVDTLIAHVA